MGRVSVTGTLGPDKIRTVTIASAARLPHVHLDPGSASARKSQYPDHASAPASATAMRTTRGQPPALSIGSKLMRASKQSAATARPPLRPARPRRPEAYR